MSTDNFVKYLNFIKNKDKFDYLDAMHFNETVNTHYYTYFPPVAPSLYNNNRSIYDLYDYLPSNDHNEVMKKTSLLNSYIYKDGWIIKDSDYLPKIPEVIQKTKRVSIDVSINNINDILKIINENPYCEDTEYNIDLKSLHNIKAELVELNDMIGMTNFKESLLNQILYFIQNLHTNAKCSDFKHTVIYGPPGTGKTEIAKILGRIYSKIGILNNNFEYIFKKVTRNDLIAGYLGQTAIKTKTVINQCIGGVLFIDEAYSLGSKGDNDSFSNECIDILCESMSDHKDNLMVIIAGYEDELNERFFTLNKGLSSRFIWRFKIDNYTHVELMNIFKKKIEDIEWSFDSENVLNKKWFENKYNNFKNYGRDMELLVFYVKIAHSRRIYGKDESLRKKICEQDLENGYKMFLENIKVKESPVFHGLYV